MKIEIDLNERTLRALNDLQSRNPNYTKGDLIAAAIDALIMQGDPPGTYFALDAEAVRSLIWDVALWAFKLDDPILMRVYRQFFNRLKQL